MHSDDMKQEMQDILEIEEHDRSQARKQNRKSYRAAMGMESGGAAKKDKEFKWKPPVGAIFPEGFEFCGLQGCWDMMDADGGGSISQEEFADIVKKYQYNRQNNDVIYFVLDADGDEISRDEFILGLKALRRKHKAAAGDPFRKSEEAPKPTDKVFFYKLLSGVCGKGGRVVLEEGRGYVVLSWILVPRKERLSLFVRLTGTNHPICVTSHVLYKNSQRCVKSSGQWNVGNKWRRTTTRGRIARKWNGCRRKWPRVSQTP